MATVFIPWTSPADRVEIAGDFIGGWDNREPMLKINQNLHIFFKENVEPRSYSYKFIVDDKWEYDTNRSTDTTGYKNNTINLTTGINGYIYVPLTYSAKPNDSVRLGGTFNPNWEYKNALYDDNIKKWIYFISPNRNVLYDYKWLINNRYCSNCDYPCRTDGHYNNNYGCVTKDVYDVMLEMQINNFKRIQEQTNGSYNNNYRYIPKTLEIQKNDFKRIQESNNKLRCLLHVQDMDFPQLKELNIPGIEIIDDKEIKLAFYAVHAKTRLETADITTEKFTSFCEKYPSARKVILALINGTGPSGRLEYKDYDVFKIFTHDLPWKIDTNTSRDSIEKISNLISNMVNL